MGVWDWDPASGELFVDERIARLHGIAPASFDGRMETILATIHTDDRPAVEAGIAETLATGNSFAAEFRVTRPDGTTVWIQGRGAALLDEQGRPTRMVGVGLDTTALRSMRERAGRSLDHISDGLVLLDSAYRIDYANEEAAALFDRARDDLIGRTFWEGFPEIVDPGVPQQYEEAMRSQQPRTFEVFVPALSAWSELRCFPAADGLTVFIRDVSDRRRAEAERERLLAAEQVARTRLSVLADASQRLAGSLDQTDIVETLTALLVPALADWVVIDLADDGVLRRVGVIHGDPQHKAVAEELLSDRRAEVAPQSPPGRVFTSGEPILAHPPDEDFLAAMSAAHDAAVLRPLGAEAALILPLVSRGTIVGVVSLFIAGTGRRFQHDDVSLAEQLATRAALALENAALYRREHQVADALQRAVLPERLPDIEGYELAARYVPATSDVEVAGDWYDAFPTGAGTFGLAVGDVAGHGLPAASMMGQLRNALRAYAVQAGPGAVLTELSDLLAAVEPEAMATATYAELDVSRGLLWWASAGHPPPLVIPAEGPPFLLPETVSPPLSAVAADLAEPVPAHDLYLDAGGVICWYTDGLVERRDEGLDERLQVLVSTAAGIPTGATAEQICDDIVTGMLGAEGGTDDVCLLVMRRLPVGAGDS